MRGIPLFTGYPRILTVKDGILLLNESKINRFACVIKGISAHPDNLDTRPIVKASPEFRSLV